MGIVEIPKIDVELPIYHTTDEEVLQIGAGHLEGSSLPVGGESTHAVISAHRGLPSAKLFTDLDQMAEGDVFYLHILDETLAYEVDQILPMVDKDDTEALTEALAIEEGKDYVTLFTCTPYGVNTHRLLVRGVRTEYNGEEERPEDPGGDRQRAAAGLLHVLPAGRRGRDGPGDRGDPGPGQKEGEKERIDGRGWQSRREQKRRVS